MANPPERPIDSEYIPKSKFSFFLIFSRGRGRNLDWGVKHEVGDEHEGGADVGFQDEARSEVEPTCPYSSPKNS